MIEWFFPALYAMALHAHQQFNQRHRHQAGGTINMEDFPSGSWECFSSETNARFLSNLKECTFFWLQDAPILLRDHPGLANVDPWKTFLSDPVNVVDLATLGNVVFSNVDQAVIQEQKLLLHQSDLHKSVRDGVLQVYTQLDGRMSTLPTSVKEEVKGIVNAEFDQLRDTLYTDVQHAFRSSLRTMVAGMVGEQQQQGGRQPQQHDNRQQQQGGQPADGGQPEQPADGGQPEQGARPLPHYRYPTAATPFPLPHCRYPIAATPPPLPHCRYPTTTLGGRPQQQNNGQPEQQQQQEQQQQGGPPDLGAAATASPAWAPPVPVQLDHAPSTVLPLAPTQLGHDGWMLGNDLQTVTSVWQLHLVISAWLADHEDRRERWWGTDVGHVKLPGFQWQTGKAYVSSLNAYKK